MSAQRCPLRIELQQFANGLVPDSLADRLNGHVQECAMCKTLLQAFEAESFGPLRTIGTFPRLANASAAETSAVQEILAIADSNRTLTLEPPQQLRCAPPPANLDGFQLQALVARGGMGQVWRGWDTQLRRTVAIKFLHHASPQSLPRFLREMRVVAGLDHQNVVRAYQAGEAGGLPYLVMEYITGANLAELARAVQPMAIPDACELVRQIAVGADHVHRVGRLVHRDIKPANAMLAADGSVKLLDLGVAAFNDPDEASSELTCDGDVLGTIAYIAPEQLDGSQAVGVATDIHGLGATLYRLLSGHAPFGRPASVAKRLEAVRLSKFLPLHECRSGLPDELVELVHQMLAAKMADRPATAAHVATALKPFTVGADLTSLVRRAMQLHEDASAQQAVFDESPTTILQSARQVGFLSARATWAALSVSIATLVVALGLALWSRSNPATSTTPSLALTETEASDDQRQALAVMQNTVEELSDMIAHDPNLNEPEMLPRRREMLARLRQMYTNTRDRFGSDPAMLRDLANAYHSLAISTLTVDSPREALTVFEQQLEFGRELVAVAPEDATTINIMARSLAGIGVMWLHLGEDEKARTALTEATNQFAELVRNNPETMRHRFSLSQCYLNLSALYEQSGAATAAIEACQQGVAALRPAIDAEPENSDFDQLMALHCQNLGAAHLLAKEENAAITAFDEGIAILRRLVVEPAKGQESRGRLGILLILAGQARLAVRDLDGAESVLREAIAIEQRLQGEYPGARAYEIDQAKGWIALGNLLQARGKPAEALPALAQAIQLARNVFLRDPTVADARQGLSAAYQAMITFHDDQNDSKAANDARNELESLIRENDTGHDEAGSN